VHVLAGLNYPPIGELVDWKSFGPLGLDKTILLVLLACTITVVFFVVAGRKKALVPTGAQNLAEMAVEFIVDGVIMETIGPDGLGFLPYLLTLFCFLFILNIFEVIPLFQFPAAARMAIPLFLALITWGMYNFVGIKKQGFGHYLRSSCLPPGVPKAINYFLVAPIEFLQILLIRPFSLAVRLFANMLAGHLLLVTFALLTDALLFHNAVLWLKPLAVLPAAVGIGLTAFEILVAVLQAFIFTILTAVYVGLAMHPEH